MHNRKNYVIYPPAYKPGDGYVIRHSKRQAWKVAIRMGVGACVDVCTHKHRGKRTFWTGSTQEALWEVSFSGGCDEIQRP